MASRVTGKRAEVRLKEVLAGREGLKIAVAESCTGGLLSHTITNVPGSSRYFAGAVVAYSNEVKKKLLGVRPATLAKFGAVSARTAEEMAAGVRARLGAGIGVSVTGVAGPGGGSADKPVGTVFVCVTGKGAKQGARKLSLSGSRSSIKKQTVACALDMLIEFLASGE